MLSFMTFPHTLIHSTHRKLALQLWFISSCEQCNCVWPVKGRRAGLTSLCVGVQMMSYTGGGGERTGTSAALKCWIQSQNSVLSRHDTTMGLISFPGKRGGEDKVCHSVHSLGGMCYSRIVILGIKSAHSWGVTLCDASGFMEKAMHKNVHSLKSP